MRNDRLDLKLITHSKLYENGGLHHINSRDNRVKYSPFSLAKEKGGKKPDTRKLVFVSGSFP